MFNLMRRDLIIQKWQLLVFIPFILVFILTNSHPILTFLVSSFYIPFNAYYYDEKAETNILLNSLPYTRKEIIARSEERRVGKESRCRWGRDYRKKRCKKKSNVV